jgi:hypothetical protein
MQKSEQFLLHWLLQMKVIVEEFNFGQPREKVIDRAVNKSI